MQEHNLIDQVEFWGGIDLKSISLKHDVSRSYISMITHGKRKNINITMDIMKAIENRKEQLRKALLPDNPIEIK